MDFFISTFRNRIDAKGRVSVPASFRALLTRQGPEGGVYLAPDVAAAATHESRVLIGGGTAYLASLHEQIAQVPEFSAARENLELSLLSELVMANLDPEGRIVLSADLLKQAGLEAPGEAVFVGRGNKFQIWEPKAWAARLADARAGTIDRFRTMGGAK